MNYQDIKLLVLDCDGVMTDGKINYDENLVEQKQFNAKDGLGIKLLSFTDIQVAVITGRKSSMVKQRCRDLNIKLYFQKIRNKLKCAEDLRKKLNLQWNEIAYIGDDWNDYPVMKKVGIKVVPGDAFDDLKQIADVVTERKGGDGAVREFINLLLKEKGMYEATLEKFIAYLESM